MIPELSKAIKVDSINDPTLNIKAGVAYLLTRLVTLRRKSERDKIDLKDYTYTIVANDTLEKIAMKVGTTVDELMSSKAGVIHPKEVLKYHQAKMVDYISGWRGFTLELIVERYNGVNGG